MVHRIQNRNPGYSDFGSGSPAQSFNFSSLVSSPMTNGANALKLENEITTESAINNSSSEILNGQGQSNHNVEGVAENNQSSDYEQSFAEESLSAINEIEESGSTESEHASNGLENFGVEGEAAPDLFNSDNEIKESESLLTSETSGNISEEDDLEIPAFLRRQKN